MKKKRKAGRIAIYAIIIGGGVLMLYPIVWMFFATFKTNAEIFGSTGLLPESFSLDGYREGWKGSGQYTYATFFMNSLFMVLPTTILTVVSCSLVAYGFARFKFRFKKFLLALLISTMMLPNAVLIIPRYLLFTRLNWINTYLPFWVPALLAVYPFFIFMLIQFIRGIPRELDESAYIDGCGTFRVYRDILLPLMKPSLFSVGLFQVMWTYNDYLNPLMFINSVNKYPIALALRLSLDSESVVNWSKVMSMSFVALAPLIILFFVAQKYFVEGVATSGLKG